MAKYSKKAGDKVEKAMHERKHGTLKSGRSGRKVKSRAQAIAIGLSEARAEGAKVPKKKGAKKAAKKKTAKKGAAKKTARKGTARKKTAKKGAARKRTAKKGTARKSTTRKRSARS